MKLTRREVFSIVPAVAGLSALALAGCKPSEPTEAGEQPSDSSVDETKAQDSDHIPDAWSLLTLQQKVAQLFVARPEALAGVQGNASGAEDSASSSASDAAEEVTDGILAGIGDIPVCGFAFFGGNLKGPRQSTELLASLTNAIDQACSIPPLLCVDEEGGTVARIASNDAFGVENVGDMAAIGARGDADVAKAAAERISEYLQAIGFNVDFAPVADIANNPDSQIMVRRSFGREAELVAEMVAAQVEGFNESGMACCLKHFPGIGAATADTHSSTSIIDSTLEELLGTELVPFAAGIEAGAPMVMMSHLSVPSVTGTDVPASLSKTMVSDILRGHLGFDGVVITDSLEMGAISDAYESSEAAVLAIEAGCDVILMPADLRRAYDAVLDAVARGRISESRIDESLERIRKLKERFGMQLAAGSDLETI